MASSETSAKRAKQGHHHPLERQPQPPVIVLSQSAQSLQPIFSHAVRDDDHDDDECQDKHEKPLHLLHSRKRNMQVRESPWTQARDVEMMTSLIANMNDHLFVSRAEELRASNASLKASIQAVQSNMILATQSSKPEISSLLLTLQRYDPGSKTIRETKDMLNKVDGLCASKFRWSAGHCRASRSRSVLTSDQEMNKLLQKRLWHTEQRAVHIRHMLASIVAVLQPEIERHSAMQQKIVQDDMYMALIFKFLPVEELVRHTVVCRTWCQIIQERNLILGGHKTKNQRASLWAAKALTGSISRIPIQIAASYETLLEKAMHTPPENKSLIVRDCQRTTFAHPQDLYASSLQCGFTRIGNVQNGPELDAVRAHQAILERILCSYAVYNPQVGYCQGMTFSAALIMSCTEFDETKSFHMFVSFMENYDMKEIFRNGMMGTMLRLYQLERLIKWFLPEVQVEFERNHIQPLLWATSWIMTMFSSDMTLHPNLAGRFLDIFFSKGWTGIFAVMLGLIAVHKAEILGKSMNQILQKMNKITNHMTLSEFEQIVAAAASMEVSAERLEAIEQDYRRSHRRQKF